MRTLKWLAMAALAVSTTACVETVDQGYGYSNGYYAPDQAYVPQQSYYAPTYYTPTRVVTQTRYVPVPVAVPQRNVDRSNDRRDGAQAADRGDRHDHPQANNTPPASHPASHQPSNNTQHRGNANTNDRDGDGRPDRQS